MLRPGQVTAVVLGAFLFAGLSGGRAAAATAEREVRFEGDGYARIPFDLRGSHVWVRGTIGSSDSLWIVIDTGGSSALLDAAVAESLGLAQHGQVQSRGSGGAATGRLVSNVDIHLPGLTIHRDQLPTTALADISTAGRRPMQLIIGYALFASCVVRFDYAAQVLEVWDPEHAPNPIPGVGVPLKLQQNLPYVEGVLEVPGRAPIRGRFLLDTGSAAALMVGAEVTEREKLMTAFPRTIEQLARGVGGAMRNRVGRADAFSVGTLRFEKPTVMMQQPGAGRISAPGTVGNMGGPMLGRCRVTFDYAGRKVYLEPGAGFAEPFEADMSGATITPDGAGWAVRLVNPETPAAEAGLRAGDVVVHVNGEPADQLDPIAVRRLFSTEGATVTIGVRRGGEESTVTLRLRRLI